MLFPRAKTSAGGPSRSSNRGSPGSAAGARVRLLHGKPLAETLNAQSAARSAALQSRGITPRLAAVSVGADPAANTYVQRLVSRGKLLGIAVADVALPRDTTERVLITALERSGVDANLLRVERALKLAIPVTCITSRRFLTT